MLSERLASRHRSEAEIRAELDVYKTFAGRELSDDLCFSILLYVVFYSGFRAATVTARTETINRWFPNWRTVADYGAEDVKAIMSDPGMIRNERKINACIENAKRSCGKLIQEHASGKTSCGMDSPLPAP